MQCLTCHVYALLPQGNHYVSLRVTKEGASHPVATVTPPVCTDLKNKEQDVSEVKNKEQEEQEVKKKEQQEEKIENQEHQEPEVENKEQEEDEIRNKEQQESEVHPVPPWPVHTPTQGN